MHRNHTDTGMGKDHTLFAKVPGVVFFHRAQKQTPQGVIKRRFISILPTAQADDADFRHQVEQGPIVSFQQLQERKERKERLRVTAPGYSRHAMRAPDAPVEAKFGGPKK
jgi:hypothetical protein